MWVTQVTDSKVYLEDSFGKKISDDIETFEQEWSGIALAIEDIVDAGEPSYKEKYDKGLRKKIFEYTFMSSYMILLFALVYFSWMNDTAISILCKLILLFVNMTGCYIAYTLIKQEKFQINRLAQRFCKVGKHIDCFQVTRSNYSKFFGWLSWAELGIAYFSAVTLWVAIAPISSHWISPLWWLLLLPLPFTLWSLYTQVFLIRKWCLFCCTIVFILWLNALILYFILPQCNVFPIIESLLAALLLLTCTAVVFYISKTRKVIDPYLEERQMARIKYNVPIIRSQLSETNYETKNIGLTWGDPQSSHEIILYISVGCSHCGKAVKELGRLMEIYPNLHYRLIFALNPNSSNDETNIITRNFICYYRNLSKNEFFNVLDTWYALPEKTLDALQKAYPTLYTQYDCKKEIDILYEFNQQNKINYAPAIFLDGRLLSHIYNYMDLYGIARAINAE